MKFKKLPVGVEDFPTMIEKKNYYVDKTLLIKELLDKHGAVTLFTRPRRFGKTLNMSMLQTYFDVLEKDKAYLFDGLGILQTGSSYLTHQNHYPVISLSFKNIEGDSFLSAYMNFQNAIIKEFRRHRYLLESSQVDEGIKKQMSQVLATENMKLLQEGKKSAILSTQILFEDSLLLLTEALKAHYGKRVVVLIDEYDVPLEKSYFKGFYEEMLSFIRNLFHKALKTNNALAFTVMTGCLRVSKESIFTGLNNLHIIGITNTAYSEYFGFTETEVREMLYYYGLAGKKEEIQKWYNGYQFGETVVYNPWSTVHYVFNMVDAKEKGATVYPVSHWSNTSSNHIIKQLIEQADEETREEIEALIQGESLTKVIKEDIVYGEIQQNMDNLWNFLFFTGYLKKKSQKMVDEDICVELEIPNLEIRKIYRDKILEWFNQKVKVENPRELLQMILNKDTEQLSEVLNTRLMDMISYYDTKENFYHGFLLGILSNLSGYVVKSNREAGTGRSDIFLKSRGIQKQAVIFELKIIGEKEDAVTVVKSALKQIQDRNYEKELESEGYRNILKYGVAFRGKECLIVVDE